jgi:hypothetical protein
MPDSFQTETAGSDLNAGRERLVADLERRIVEIESLDDSDIGAFTGLDWFICIVGSVILPAIAIWWFAG